MCLCSRQTRSRKWVLAACLSSGLLIISQDFSSKAEDVAVTLNGFSQIVNADLARDLGPDIVKMLTHSRAHIRKRAIVALYKILDKHPELSDAAAQRLRERLEDDDPGALLLLVSS